MERHFLGWDQPGLEAASAYLIEHYAQERELDLQNVCLVVPGARAGRRLLEILVQSAAGQALGLTPPAILTAGVLAEALAEPVRPQASKLLRLLVWREVLQGAPDSVRNLFLTRTPPPESLAGWLPWGDFFDRIFEELASGCLSIEAVLERASEVDGFADESRWLALSTLRDAYLARLETLGYEDPQAGRLLTLAERRCRTNADIILIGMADLSVLLRRMLDTLSTPCMALVLAPPSRAEAFDKYGCICPDYWCQLKIPLAEPSIHVADRPSGQAAALLRTLESFGSRYAPEDIAVGAPDEEVIPYVEQALERHGIASHRGDGHSVLQSAPAKFLLRLENYLRDGRFASFAELVRDPAVERLLTGAGANENWLGQLDAYRDAHLPYALPTRWLDLAGNTQLEDLSARLDTFLAELRGPPRTLDRWARVILETLLGVFDERPLHPERGADRQQLELFEAVHAGLVEMAHTDPRVTPQTTAADALRLLLHRLGTRKVAEIGVDGAIDLLGWLEIPLDDRPALIVTGLNDGRIPSVVLGDPLLPNSLRGALGLLDNMRRHARDAYALTVALHCRRETHVILGRRSADGSPLLPSRLLLAVPREQLPTRVELLFPEHLPDDTELDDQGASSEPPNWLPRPANTHRRIEALSVTALSDYLRCPYGFYLRRVLGLRAVEETVHELDALAFGNLAHDALSAFGSGPLADSDDADQITGYLDRALRRLVRQRFGKHPQPAVLVQVEQLRAKLHAFAEWQAGWRREGWRIQQTEVPVEPALGTLIKGEKHQLSLRGRLDRIDVHEVTREFAVLDYKTTESGPTPEKTHRQRGVWTDLQLPLYRVLARSLGTPDPIRLGYVVLPKDIRGVGVRLADWSETDLREAEATAGWVVDQIGEGNFWPPTLPPPRFNAELTELYPSGPAPSQEPLEEVVGE